MTLVYRKDGDDLVLERDGEILFLLEPSGSLGIMRDGGILLKHGPARNVRSDETRYRAALGASGVQDVRLEVVEIPVSGLTEEMVEEINACVHTSGRVAKLDEALLRMAGDPAPDGMSLTAH